MTYVIHKPCIRSSSPRVLRCPEKEHLPGLKKTRQNKTKQKNALYLSVNVFSTKILIGDTILTSPTGDGPPFYVVIRATQRTNRLQGKGSSFISQLS